MSDLEVSALQRFRRDNTQPPRLQHASHQSSANKQTAMAAADTIVSQAAGPGGRGIDALCLGSGRFLRSVLVPFLSAHCKQAIFQTRGRTFVDSFQSECGDGVVDGKGVAASLQYEVDTKQFDGSVSTDKIEVYAAGTLGTPAGKSHLMDDLLSTLDDLSVIGVGVTEAGLQSADKQCMLDLTQVLYKAYCCKVKCSNPNGRICVVNTDNVPNNGDVIWGHVLTNAKKYVSEKGGEGFVDFVEHKVAFLNSMVDRITSSRPESNGLVPLCEPLPAKALVICDLGKDLPQWMDEEDVQSRFGVRDAFLSTLQGTYCFALPCAHHVATDTGEDSPRSKGARLRHRP